MLNNVKICINKAFFCSLKLISFLFFFFLLHIGAKSQCTITNNSFVVQTACASGVVFLQGSAPSGGTGTYTYIWEMNPNDCGEGQGGFVPIPGATGPHYIVPPSNDPRICFRRIVISGSCRDESKQEQVNRNNLPAPLPPTVDATQPGCTVATGTITVTNPAPTTGISYSINGSDYTNTTGKYYSPYYYWDYNP
jgi:hypothetical protein